MSSQIKVIIAFNQLDHKGKEQMIRVTAEKEVAAEILEQIDDCESNLMEVAYAAMRSGMSTQMSYVSKKNTCSRSRTNSKRASLADVSCCEILCTKGIQV